MASHDNQHARSGIGTRRSNSGVLETAERITGGTRGRANGPAPTANPDSPASTPDASLASKLSRKWTKVKARMKGARKNSHSPPGEIAVNMSSNSRAEPIHRASRSDPAKNAPRSGSLDLYRTSSRIRLSAHPNNERIDPNKLKLLPATAEVFYGDKLEKFRWKGTIESLLAGTRDKSSPLAMLRQHEATIVREIHSFIGSQWARHVKLTVPAALVGGCCLNPCYMQFNHGRRGPDNWSRRIIKEGHVGPTSSGFDDGFVAYARCGQVEFPDATGRNVNMMPFIFGKMDSLPTDLQCYFPLIEKCPYVKEDLGRVGYLTVHESYVDVREAQRREGLHIESPGVFSHDLDSTNVSSFTPGQEHPWGCGVFWGHDKYEGGIYMASNVKDTSEVWDALVDSRVPGIVDHHGGCEHLRGLIGQGTKLEAGELIWMTDSTPHEALPQKESGYRQFFRVVTPCVSHWYADHSTENPNVPVPGNVTVVWGNKFA